MLAVLRERVLHDSGYGLQSGALTMLGIYQGHPAIYDPVSRQCVVVFNRTAHGWSKAVKLAVELAREIEVRQ